MDLSREMQMEIEAATFRRFIAHLDENKDVQNIDLMILANFCRNCLSKWYAEEAGSRGASLDYSQAREIIYGMSYDEWKQNFQPEATEEQLSQLNSKEK
jgi:hypothetical protein